jgi:hypothetical protein
VTITDYAAIEAALRAVAGVAEAEVRPDEDGSGLGLLRLGLDPGADEVRVATDVGQLLRDRFGLGVDADRVQLIEDTAGPADEPDLTIETAVPGPPPAPPAPAAAPASPGSAAAPGAATAQAARRPTVARPAIGRMQLVSAGLDVTAKVTVKFAGRSALGENTGTATTTGVQRAVALATLHALEELVGRAARFELEDIEISTAGRQNTVLAVVTMLTDRGGERLTGSATVREDVRQACIRAILHAVNRRLQLLLPG